MAKVIIIGGGPAGMMAGIKASENHDVTIVESNEKLGKKMFITGKGRCNITNNKDISEFFDNILGNPHFLYSALYSFSNENVKEFLENSKVPLKVERGDRVFPSSDKSSDIINAFERELKKRNVKVMLKSKVLDINIKNNKIVSIKLENGNELKSDYFIIATGGKSYPQTGSTGMGYTFAKKCGHTIIDPFPSLVGITVSESLVKDLQGLSLKNVELRLVEGKKKLYKNLGEMLFTHFGISGPLVLSASRKVHNSKNLKAIINLKPALSEKELDLRIQKDFMKFQNKNFKNSLDDLLPKKLINTIILLSGINENKKVNSITKEERKNLIFALQNLTLTVTGTRPIEEAIITAGGVDTKEVEPSTMKSKIMDNLYFAGEVIDVDAVTGGYNMQIALSTGYLAGMLV